MSEFLRSYLTVAIFGALAIVLLVDLTVRLIEPGITPTDRYGVVGLSGGGPYALACAHAQPDRVVAAALLGGVAPARGDEAAPGGLVQLAAMAKPLLPFVTLPASGVMWAGIGMPF